MNARWLESGVRIEASELAREGIVAQELPVDPGGYEGPLDALKAARGYVKQDVVALSPETAGLAVIAERFWGEHSHSDDEVRFVLEGAGIFDIRSTDDRWMRVTVGPGDLIVVPEDRNHRFRLTEANTIRCVRLFQDEAGWAANYRA